MSFIPSLKRLGFSDMEDKIASNGELFDGTISMQLGASLVGQNLETLSKLQDNPDLLSQIYVRYSSFLTDEQIRGLEEFRAALRVLDLHQHQALVRLMSTYLLSSLMISVLMEKDKVDREAGSAFIKRLLNAHNHMYGILKSSTYEGPVHGVRAMPVEVREAGTLVTQVVRLMMLQENGGLALAREKARSKYGRCYKEVWSLDGLKKDTKMLIEWTAEEERIVRDMEKDIALSVAGNTLVHGMLPGSNYISAANGALDISRKEALKRDAKAGVQLIAFAGVFKLLGLAVESAGAASVLGQVISGATIGGSIGLPLYIGTSLISDDIAQSGELFTDNQVLYGGLAIAMAVLGSRVRVGEPVRAVNASETRVGEMLLVAKERIGNFFDDMIPPGVRNNDLAAITPDGQVVPVNMNRPIEMSVDNIFPAVRGLSPNSRSGGKYLRAIRKGSRGKTRAKTSGSGRKGVRVKRMKGPLIYHKKLGLWRPNEWIQLVFRFEGRIIRANQSIADDLLGFDLKVPNNMIQIFEDKIDEIFSRYGNFSRSPGSSVWEGKSIYVSRFGERFSIENLSKKPGEKGAFEEVLRFFQEIAD
jgi:hypothetical protein